MIFIIIYKLYILHEQGDFGLMSFTAGRCSTPLIVCSNVTSRPNRKPIATNPDRRTSEASPPASDRKAVTNRTALVVQYAFDPATTSDVVHGSEVLKFEIEGNSSKQQRGSGPYYEFYCLS